MSHFVIRTATFLASASLLASAAMAQTPAPAAKPAASRASAGDARTMVAASDKSFVMDAAMGGMTEVELGKVAQQNAMKASVKEFGAHMVEDHSKANDELATIAQSRGLTPPPELDSRHRQLVDRLKVLKGAQFDKAYMAQMLDDHKKTIALFEKESRSGKDGDTKAFATKTLPTLKSHLEMAQKVNKEAKG
jgi:putative membrane protein